MSIRVLYDAAGFDSQRFGGVTHYFLSALRGMGDAVAPIFAIAETENIPLHEYRPEIPLVHPKEIKKEDFLPLLPGFISRKIYRYVKKHNPEKLRHMPASVNAKALAAAVRREDYDIVHLTGCHSFGNALDMNFGKPVVITVHDLIPDLAQTKDIIRNRRRLLEIATRIIAVSESTKNDLIRLYSVPADKISVIPHGHLTLSGKAVPVPGLDRFLLYMGLRKGWPHGDRTFVDYKNFGFMVRAIAPFLREDRELVLFCTGQPFTEPEVALFRELGIAEQVRQDFVNGAEIEWLYTHAAALMYPSVYEGFGIPIIDAMFCGCPVVCCNSSCLPEVAGEAALYFDRGDEEGLRAAVRKLSDKAARSNLVALGKRRADMFTWDRTAADTLKVYKEAIGAFG